MENLALGKPATQSDVLWSYKPGLAVDGDPNTCSFTSREESPRWWQVESLSFFFDFGKDKDKDTDKGNFKMVAGGEPCLFTFHKEKDKYKGEDKGNFKCS